MVEDNDRHFKETQSPHFKPKPLPDHLRTPETTQWFGSELSLASVFRSTESQIAGQDTDRTDEAFTYKDTGWAWVILASAFFANAICIGSTLTIGVYNVALLEYFGESKSVTSTVMAVCMFLRGMAGFPASLLINTWGCRYTVWLGGLMAMSGSVLSFYANSIQYLIASFGIIGIGCGMGYCSATVVVSQYFEKRRHFALGILATGASTGTFLLPPLLQGSIEAYTWRGSMFILAGVYSHLLISGAVMRPVPEEDSNHQTIKQRMKAMFDLKPLKLRTFWILLIVTLTFMAGISATFTHFPAYSVEEGSSKLQASSLISVIGFTSIISRFLSGILVGTGQICVFVYTSAALGLCGIACNALPLMIKHFASQCVFAGVFGLYFSPFIAFLAALCSEIVGLSSLSSAFGYVMIAQGIASLASPPLAGYLFDATRSYEYTFYVTGMELLLASVLTMVIAGKHGAYQTEQNKESDIELNNEQYCQKPDVTDTQAEKPNRNEERDIGSTNLHVSQHTETEANIAVRSKP